MLTLLNVLDPYEGLYYNIVLYIGSNVQAIYIAVFITYVYIFIITFLLLFFYRDVCFCTGELLHEFFNFVSHFDFVSHGISLIDGRPFSKHTGSAMHIENPLDLQHNISKNINSSYVTRLQQEALKSLTCLDTKRSASTNDLWGVMSLFQSEGSKDHPAACSMDSLFRDEDGMTDSHLSETCQDPDVVVLQCVTDSSLDQSDSNNTYLLCDNV